MATQLERPSQTVYIKNLTEKLSKDKLRRQLCNLFSRFGSVLDVVVRKGQVTRGQAWVVFGSVESSTKAITTLQRYPFFEKELVLNFAKENADVVAKLEGTYVKRAKKVREEPVPKKMRVAEEEAVAPAPAPAHTRALAPIAAIAGGSDSNNPPGPVLKTDNLPEEASSELLQELFSKFEGFQEVRYAAAKHVAFIEFAGTEQAKVAREGLKGHQLTETHRLRVNFAKQ